MYYYCRFKDLKMQLKGFPNNVNAAENSMHKCIRKKYFNEFQ